MNKSPFVIARTFAAPRELVWKAWTEADRLPRWWGPTGFAVQVGTLNVRPGGTFHYAMRGPGNAVLWGLFQYREVEAPERLVFLNSFSNAAGEVVRAPFNGLWPLATLSTIAFTERQGGTTVTVQWQPHAASDAEWQTFDAGRDSMNQGWTGTFEQLEAYLAGAR